MITLYDYQKEALSKIRKVFRSRKTALAVMATGLGKTIVAAFWSKRNVERGHKGLFLCHENDILDQTLVEFRKVLGPLVSLKTFYGTDKDWRADEADILFASFQSFKRWHKAFHEDEFDFIIVDESHHGQAPTYKEVIQYFTPKNLLGITATPNREDEKDIREIFGEEIIDYSLEESIAKGWLTQVEYRILSDGLNQPRLKRLVKDVLEKGRRISIKQLNESIFVEARDEEIARIIQGHNGRKAVIFCENIPHTDNFQRFLSGSKTFHSKNSRRTNRRRLEAFREGRLKYIVAVNKFNEGIDVPDADLIVFLRCTDSKIIFFQQLGRGLRKVLGKEKVVVLDFVANCERLAMVREMSEKIKELSSGHTPFYRGELHVSGKGFDFRFDEKILDILHVIKRIKNPFYLTWQEASEAATNLKIGSQREYQLRYREDPKLPSNPQHIYKNFPGFVIFLKTGKIIRLPKHFCKTWQEASRIVQSLGIKNKRQYTMRYKESQELPCNPHSYYDDFPGWNIFLKKEEKYSTWQEASKAAICLRIKTQEEYRVKYKKDSKLPSTPREYYDDFPGFGVFLGKKKGIKRKRNWYPTWQEASDASVSLGINTMAEYLLLYKKDPKLPSSPNRTYPDFPNWTIFLKKEERRIRLRKPRGYPTWQESSRVAKNAGLKSGREYFERYKEIDSRLPSNPPVFYKDFPGWLLFLGKNKKIDGRLYPTWQEASRSAIELGITSSKNYLVHYKKDSMLPSYPRAYYPDFPGWNIFLGRKNTLYPTWQEASLASIKLAIKTSTEYRVKYRLDPRLPSNPSQKYKNFPGWKIFLGKKPKKRKKK